jgi:hypothetical protein
VVKYDPETDVHSFYYQQQGLTERKQSPLEDFEGLQFRMVHDNGQLFVNAFDSSGSNELGHVTFDIGDGKELDPQNLYVKHKVRSQGIARTMYDFVKSKGYKIQRSWDQTDAGAGFWDKHRGEERVWEQDVAAGKITLSTDPDWYGAEVGDYKASGPVVNIPANQLVGFEPDDKMNQPKSKANVEKIVAGLKQGDKLPPLLVRKYKDGYQVLDGHHRFWAYKLLGVKSIPAQIVPAEDIEEIDKQGVAEDESNDTAISLSKLGKFHPGTDTLAEFVPERATAQYALHPDKWESTFYSLTNKDSDKLKYYGPKKISIPPGTLVGDMAIANKFYRAKTPEEQEQYAELYKASLQPYPVDVSQYRMPELLIPKQGVAENFADGRNPQDKGDSKRHGINTKASVSSLRKTAKQGGRKGQLAHWLANMKSGRAKKK